MSENKIAIYIGFCVILLTILFGLAKLTGMIDWAWIYIFSPVILTVSIWLMGLVLAAKIDNGIEE